MDVIFFPHALLGPLHGDLAFPGVSVDPAVVIFRPLLQHFLGDGRDTEYFPLSAIGLPFGVRT